MTRSVRKARDWFYGTDNVRNSVDRAVSVPRQRTWLGRQAFKLCFRPDYSFI